MDEEFIKKIGGRLKLFNKIHSLLLSVSKKVSFRIFPIYVLYFIGDKAIAIIYYKGKFTNNGNELDLGINLNYDIAKGIFRDAKYMKYPGINFSISLKSEKDLKADIIKVIKSITI